MSNVFLFTGENLQKLTEEKRRWKSNFIEKYGEDTLLELDGNSLSCNELMDEISTMPFLSPKRLLFVRDVPTWTKEQMEAIPTIIHPDVILVFIDPKPDKRGAGVKALLKLADKKEFLPLKGPQVISWLREYEQEHAVSMQPDARTLLVELIGEDSAMLAREIEKLECSRVSQSVDVKYIEQTVIPTDEGVIWRISDLLCAGSKDKAFLYARRMLDRGADAYGLWAILLSVLRNVVSVKAALEAGHTSPKDIADASGVHIFAIRSLLPYAKRASSKDLRSFLSWATDTEVALKTGGIRATEGATEELLACIDTFVMNSP